MPQAVDTSNAVDSNEESTRYAIIVQMYRTATYTTKSDFVNCRYLHFEGVLAVGLKTLRLYSGHPSVRIAWLKGSSSHAHNPILAVARTGDLRRTNPPPSALCHWSDLLTRQGVSSTNSQLRVVAKRNALWPSVSFNECRDMPFQKKA
jgi:hypothetical protein